MTSAPSNPAEHWHNQFPSVPIRLRERPLSSFTVRELSCGMDSVVHHSIMLCFAESPPFAETIERLERLKRLKASWSLPQSHEVIRNGRRAV